jgi:hypothetical protein
MGRRSVKRAVLLGQVRKPKRRGRKLLLLLGLAGLGAAAMNALKDKNLSPAAAYEAPYVAPTPPEPTPEATAEPTPEPVSETPVAETLVAETPAVEEPVEQPTEPVAAPAAEPAAGADATLETPIITDPLVDPIAEGAPTPDDDGSFFEQVMAETETPPRRRTKRAPKEKPAE